MKKKWLLLLLVLSPFLCWSGCYVWQNTKLPGPSGEVEVTYRVPIKQSGDLGNDFLISGHVESVRFIPREDGYVDLEVKTTKGWYCPSGPVLLPAPIDWEKGVSVTFRYPKDMVLREKTSSFITMRYKFLGLEDRGGYGGSPLIKGDVIAVRWSREKDGNPDYPDRFYNHVAVDRVALPGSNAMRWAYDPFQIIEVLIFDHNVDAL